MYVRRSRQITRRPRYANSSTFSRAVRRGVTLQARRHYRRRYVRANRNG